MSESGIIQNTFFPARRKPETSSPAKEKLKEEAMLVERVCAGDKDAFDEFYKKLAPMVHGIVLARVPRDAVDDIVQDVFITAYQKLDTLRDKNAVSPWIAKIARNRSVEFYRRNRPTEELSENLSAGAGSKNEAQEVLDAIRTMPNAYRETLVLRLVEGMTGPEIAEKTGLKHESVRVNLHRGIKILRGKLGIRRRIRK
ncbi:MAG: sigma-70 family RNA polymerase sigma factor [Pyrinomonadaceae bacterium]|nr:sigma-70 family RNA polymerase sigma factor [Pyrinomonadaceae bacterium]